MQFPVWKWYVIYWKVSGRDIGELLESIPGQLVETDVEIDPNAELSGVYRHVGAGGTVERPTQEGPAMVFNNVKGHEGARVAIGVLSSRKRVGYLLGEDPKKLGFLLKNSVERRPPASGSAACILSICRAETCNSGG